MGDPRQGAEDGPAPPDWRGGCLRHAREHAGKRAGKLAREDGPAAPVAPRLLVLKLGGSLLSRPGWPGRVGRLLAAHRGRPCCVVVGGGAVVDGLRALDGVASADAELMHRLAIEAMRLTARLVAAQVGLPLATTPPGCGGHAVLDVPGWLAMEPRAAELPVGWGVTSDSIAALVAVVHGGGLLLAKSVPPPSSAGAGDDGLGEFARAGWVDGHFPTVAASLRELAWVAPADE